MASSNDGRAVARLPAHDEQMSWVVHPAGRVGVLCQVFGSFISWGMRGLGDFGGVGGLDKVLEVWHGGQGLLMVGEMGGAVVRCATAHA